METEQQDRRGKGVKRIDHSTLVEICGAQPDDSVFEAKSIELSGRGMRLHSRHLPEVGKPLVLRFESDGAEAVIEGQVAWTDPGLDGGQFGIKFTALDSQSVRVIKQLCRGEGQAKKTNMQPEPHAPELEPGAPVRLHIEGLGAPMKARVFELEEHRLHVGSQLEFLRLGRGLALEDVDAGERSRAEIDAVAVEIDPETQVPQLVITLKYEGAPDETPEPSVVDTSRSRRGRFEALDSEDPEEELEEAEERFRGRVGELATQAGEAMRSATQRFRLLGGQAASGTGELLSAATASVSDFAKKNKKARRKAQRTARSPSTGAARGAPRTATGRVSRSRSTGRQVPAARGAKPGRKIVALVAAGGAMAFAGYWALPGDEGETSAALPPSAIVMEEGQPIVAYAGASASASSMPAPILAPGQFPERATLDSRPQAPGSDGVVAQVPLFGPQKMATLENAAPSAPQNASVDEYGMAKDLTFARGPSLSKSATKPAAPEPRPQVAGDKEWRVGRMVLPVIHRLRLDKAGEALQGTKTPSGFTVFIPGRKVMETGKGIQGADSRITRVLVNNTPGGAKVTFRFRGDIPGYKARLRKDFVEFFVNSPKKK